MLPPVLVEDVLDHLLAPVGLDVDVDVGRAVALRGEEALEEHAPLHGVHIGDPQRVADRGVRRRPAPLAQDVVVPAERHDVEHDQEVAGEAQPLDHVQLVVDLRVRLRPRGPGSVPLGRPAVGHLAQPGHLGVPRRHRIVGQVRRDQRQVEGELVGERGRVGDRARIGGEPQRHLGPVPQVGARRGRQPAVDLVQAAPGPHRREGGGQPAPVGRRVVDVVGRHDAQPGLVGERGQVVVAFAVARVAVVGQLDRHVLRPEQRDEAVQLPRRGAGPAGLQRPRHRPLAAAGEDHGVVPQLLRDLLQVVDRAPLLLALQLGQPDDPAQPRVPLRAAGEDEQVGPDRVRLAVLRAGQLQRQLGAEHGRQSQLVGRLGEAHHPVEAVVVGEGEAGQPQPGRLLGQLLRMAGPVEEAEVGVAVQLRVGHGGRLPHELRRLVPRPLAGPGRGVPAVAVVGRDRVVDDVLVGLRQVGLGQPARQGTLHCGPRYRRVVEPHVSAPPRRSWYALSRIGKICTKIQSS